MKDLSNIFTKWKSVVLHFLGIPLFFLLFMLVFEPSKMISIISGTMTTYTFNLSIISSIIFVVLLCSRLAYHFLTASVMKMTYFRYFFWVIGEILLISAFCALFIRLVTSEVLYFDVVKVVALNIFTILSFVYIIFFLYLSFRATFDSEETDDEARLKFYDDKHLLKFITTANAVLYIKADENYVAIFHTEGDKIKEFSLRSSMKSIEELCTKNKILRCHRSYYVNVNHISTLYKEKDGITYAKLDHKSSPPIPVSQSYYSLISDVL